MGENGGKPRLSGGIVSPRAGGDPPDIDRLLKDMNWEDRLREARKRREKVLARGVKRRSPESAPALIDETKIPEDEDRTTPVPSQAADPGQKRRRAFPVLIWTGGILAGLALGALGAALVLPGLTAPPPARPALPQVTSPDTTFRLSGIAAGRPGQTPVLPGPLGRPLRAAGSVVKAAASPDSTPVVPVPVVPRPAAATVVRAVLRETSPETPPVRPAALETVPFSGQAALTVPVPDPALTPDLSVPRPAVPPLDLSGIRLTVFVPPALGDLEREFILLLVRGNGFEADPVPSPFTISGTQVRYYHAGDLAAAELLAEAVGAEMRDFTGFRPSPTEGTLELWVEGFAPKPAAPVVTEQPVDPASPVAGTVTAPSEERDTSGGSTATASGSSSANEGGSRSRDSGNNPGQGKGRNK